MSLPSAKIPRVPSSLQSVSRGAINSSNQILDKSAVCQRHNRAAQRRPPGHLSQCYQQETPNNYRGNVCCEIFFITANSVTVDNADTRPRSADEGISSEHDFPQPHSPEQ